MTMKIGDAIDSLMRDGLPVRFTAYDGSSAGPQDSEITLELTSPRGLAYLMTAPGDLGMARAYVSGDLVLHGDPMTARAEALIFAADKAQHVEEVIRPALDAAAVVMAST